MLETSGFLVYDDGCHLKKFATNPVRSTLMDTASRIAAMEIVIDKMHFKGHTDQWCSRHCNPYDFDDLQKVLCAILYMFIIYCTCFYTFL